MNRILCMLAFVLLSNVLHTQVCFHPKDSFVTGYGPGQITTGDFNGDTFIDIAVATTLGGDGIVRLLLNDSTGTGNFLPSINDTVGSNPRGIHAADFDDDGDLDIATANSGSNDVTILRNNGSGIFSIVSTVPIGSNCRYVTSGYFDSDTILDIATCNFSGGSASVALGTGGGNFNTPVNYAMGSYPHAIMAVDFNEDGELDLATANEGSDSVSIIFGIGNGTFGTSSSFATGIGTAPTGLTSGYFNADLHLDLATSNSGTNDMSILLGDGLGSFAPAVNYLVETGFYSLHSCTSGDYDMDGNLDLAVANKIGDSLFVLTGNGNGTFNSALGFWSGGSPYSITTADFNGDFADDLATANLDNQVMNVFLNCKKMDIENLPSTPSILVYPNPSNGIFNVSLENLYTNGAEIMEIYDILGKKVYSTILSDDQSNHKIDLSNYPQGTYVMTIFVGDQILTNKIVIN